MKKISLIMFFAIISFVFTMHLSALEGYTTDSGIRVRSGASVDSEAIDLIAYTHTVLDVVEDKLYNVGDPDCSSGWYKINYQGSERYICGLYVSLGKVPGPTDDVNTNGFEARIGATGVYIRTSPSSASAGYLALPGTNITVLEENISGYGCSWGWDHIKYHDNKDGYVCSRYVDKHDDIIDSDSEYEEVLRNAGFPDSYIPYLVYLHKKHPTWNFNAIQTGLYWDNVVSGEEDKQLIQTDVAAFVQNFNPVEGYDWYKSTNAVNAFYLDPRNFLTERFIFMFENLNYKYDSESTEGKENLTLNGADKDSEQTIKYYNTVSSIFTNSFLNTEEYIYDYIDAGYKYNVSPIHLASRTHQEGASDATYSAVSGTETRLYGSYSVYGYYNMFNIGAYNDDVTNNPVVRGLAFACGSACDFYDNYERPWDSIEKAIYGGTHFISAGYIAEGQNTLYFEKYNTSPTSRAYTYTNQYQTNAIAPCQEGDTAFEAYEELGLLDEEFEFDIPIYLNMPDNVSLPNVASLINSLSSIKIDGKLISGYDKDILSYDIKVSKTTNSINITTERDDEKSKVSGDGEITLDSDSKTINIVVTSESGKKRTYIINVTKVEDTTTVEDILSKLTFKTDQDILFNLSPNMQVGDMENSIKGVNDGALIVVKDSEGKVLDAGDKLETGYKVQITTLSGDIKEFSISIIGDTSGDGDVTILDLLQVQKYLLKEKNFDGAYLKAADTNGDGVVNILDLLRIQKYLLKDLTF